MTDVDVVNNAVEYFRQKFNCAESTLKAVAEAWGVSNSCVPRVASGFGGGVGGHGEICGALTGCIMALGLRFGRERGDDEEAKALLYKKVWKLITAFREEFGEIGCRELTGCDFLTPEGKKKAQEMDLHGSFCPKFVKFAVAKTLEIAEEKE